MKYLLFYTEGCSPNIRSFDSLAEAEAWAGKFLLSNQSNTDDNWVDMVVRGSIEAAYSNWAHELKVEEA